MGGLLCTPRTVSAADLDSLNPMNLFHGGKDKDKAIPSDNEMKKQETAAQALMADAKTAMSLGDTNKAMGIYKNIVKKYPHAESAAEAEYQYGTLLRNAGKMTDAFDAYEHLIAKYHRSPRFSEAVQAEYEIAEEAKNGKKQGGLLFIPMKIETSEVVKMYQAVIKNAPYGKLAPLSQFALGEINQDKGDKDAAVLNYQLVVDNYPNSKEAPEAQFRIAQISSGAASRTNDRQNTVSAREAALEYKARYAGAARSAEVESLLNRNSLASSEGDLKIAQFYEKSGKPKAAAIYYTDAIKGGANNEAALKARERLGALAATYGEELKTPGQEDSEVVVPAAKPTKNTDDYAGPPGPDAGKTSRSSSKMRVDDDNFKPLPLKEPELPNKSNLPAAPGMLVPPAPGQSASPTALPPPPPAAPGDAAPGVPAPPTPEPPKPAGQ